MESCELDDRELLTWIWERLIICEKTDPNFEWMRQFRAIIRDMSSGCKTPPCEYEEYDRERGADNG